MLANFGMQYQAMEKLRLGANDPNAIPACVGREGFTRKNLVTSVTESHIRGAMDTDNRVPAQISVEAPPGPELPVYTPELTLIISARITICRLATAQSAWN